MQRQKGSLFKAQNEQEDIKDISSSNSSKANMPKKEIEVQDQVAENQPEIAEEVKI